MSLSDRIPTTFSFSKTTIAPIFSLDRIDPNDYEKGYIYDRIFKRREFHRPVNFIPLELRTMPKEIVIPITSYVYNELNDIIRTPYLLSINYNNQDIFIINNHFSRIHLLFDKLFAGKWHAYI